MVLHYQCNCRVVHLIDYLVQLLCHPIMFRRSRQATTEKAVVGSACRQTVCEEALAIVGSVR